MANSKQAVRQVLTDSHGVDFSADFHQLASGQVQAISDAAKTWGYRKPKNANGSTARYFFEFLNREPKTELYFIVQGHYGRGWEDLTGSTVYREARDNLRDYRENDPNPTRLIKRRVPREV